MRRAFVCGAMLAAATCGWAQFYIYSGTNTVAATNRTHRLVLSGTATNIGGLAYWISDATSGGGGGGGGGLGTNEVNGLVGLTGSNLFLWVGGHSINGQPITNNGNYNIVGGTTNIWLLNNGSKVTNDTFEVVTGFGLGGALSNFAGRAQLTLRFAGNHYTNSVGTSGGLTILVTNGLVHSLTYTPILFSTSTGTGLVARTASPSSNEFLNSHGTFSQPILALAGDVTGNHNANSVTAIGGVPIAGTASAGESLMRVGGNLVWTNIVGGIAIAVTNYPSTQLFATGALFPDGSTAVPLAPEGECIMLATTNDMVRYNFAMPSQFVPSTPVRLVLHTRNDFAQSGTGRVAVAVIVPSQHTTFWPPRHVTNYWNAVNRTNLIFLAFGGTSNAVTSVELTTSIFSNASPNTVVALALWRSDGITNAFRSLQVNQ